MPGPVFFYYKPKNKEFPIFHTTSEGAWVEVHPKYRDSKKISIEQGFCIGGDYGTMKLPRYTVSTTITGVPVSEKNARALLWYAAHEKMRKLANDMASTAIRTLNKSGYLIVSCGDLQLTYTTKKELKIQFNLGMVLNVMTTAQVVQSYTQDAFVWKSINTGKQKDPTNEFPIQNSRKRQRH
jgi:hypothetical protein